MKNLLLAAVVAILSAGCSSLTVTSDYDKTTDFSKYKTLSYYGWAEESDKILTRFDKERIEKAFGEEFKKRGYTIVEKGGDVIVSLFIVVDEKTSTTAYTNHYGAGGPYGYYGYGYGAWGWGGGPSTTTYTESDYKVGTLVCDVFDSQEKKLVWQGVGQGTVNENPERRDKSIPNAVAQIMAKYPVKPTGK
ncbi:DUF4136 domain-containing protein [Flexithrix dorotheae]|uniref:DUF4136 domain-containing protein n=1 Tax=Flexithrix dorotheae TaxID=70993 RepID=UPI0003770AEE|nr:DUF4136 domain-containing protein [Flexithrix dorotheae]